MNWNDDWETEYDDQEYVMPCPHCGVTIYDDTDMCPKCGYFISADSPSWRGESVWRQRLFVLIVILVVLAFVLPMVVRLF